MENDHPVTRNELETALAEALAAVVAELKTYTDQRSERIETKLLTAFHGWARAMEIRVRNTSTIVGGADERLALLEERVSRLETGGR